MMTCLLFVCGVIDKCVKWYMYSVHERVQVDLLIIAARTIHPQSNNFATSINIKARVDSTVYDNP